MRMWQQRFIRWVGNKNIDNFFLLRFAVCGTLRCWPAALELSSPGSSTPPFARSTLCTMRHSDNSHALLRLQLSRFEYVHFNGKKPWFLQVSLVNHSRHVPFKYFENVTNEGAQFYMNCMTNLTKKMKKERGDSKCRILGSFSLIANNQNRE